MNTADKQHNRNASDLPVRINDYIIEIGLPHLAEIDKGYTDGLKLTLEPTLQIKIWAQNGSGVD